MTTTKAQISEVVSIRHESYSQYESNRFDDSGRLLKKSDCELEELIYGRVKKKLSNASLYAMPLHIHPTAKYHFRRRRCSSDCRVHEEKDKLDWKGRAEKLRKILREYKNKNGNNYDCVIQ